jgi:hypothetical protein
MSLDLCALRFLYWFFFMHMLGGVPKGATCLFIQPVVKPNKTTRQLLAWGSLSSQIFPMLSVAKTGYGLHCLQ